MSTGGGAVVRLIRGLVGMCCSSGGQPSTAMKGATEAARCLGEIGPLDLHCIALPPLTDSYSKLYGVLVKLTWVIRKLAKAQFQIRQITSLLRDSAKVD